MLMQRFITAIILIPLVIAGIYYLPKIGFDLLALLIILLAAWEFFGLFYWPLKKRIIFLTILGLIVLGIAVVIHFVLPAISLGHFLYGVIWFLFILAILLIGVMWWLIAPYFLWRYERTGYKNFIKPTLMGFVVFIPCWIGLNLIRVNGVHAVYMLLVMVWAADVGAYFVGKFCGKHLLAPKISPKKTIEGVVGGILVSLTAMIIFLNLPLVGKMHFGKMAAYLLLSVVVSIWSVIGDLFESILKREAHVKDSGKLLPGHGGIYDRIDSLITAAPIFCVGYFLIAFY